MHVCPTGIDIRDGQQLECIGCGLCIDACDEVMAKLHRPKGLIAFETLGSLARARRYPRHAAWAARTDGGYGSPSAAALPPPAHLRLRRGAVGGEPIVMLAAFLFRETLSLTAIQDRAPLFVTLSDGSVRNAYTLRHRQQAACGGRNSPWRWTAGCAAAPHPCRGRTGRRVLSPTPG